MGSNHHPQVNTCIRKNDPSPLPYIGMQPHMPAPCPASPWHSVAHATSALSHLATRAACSSFNRAAGSGAATVNRATTA